MTDYTRSTGSSGTMMIRDTGSSIEFWINSNNSTTWSDHIPWSGVVNGVNVSGSYYYHINSGWQKIVAYGVTTSQNVSFSLGATSTSGFGGPTTLGPIWINRATVPPPPTPVRYSSVGSTSLVAQFDSQGDGGSLITTWQLGYGVDPNTPLVIINSTGTSVISGLGSGYTYYFWARGVNAIGTGGWSARTQVTTLRVPDAPSSPAVVGVLGITQTSIAIKFVPNGDGGAPITGFQLSYSTAVDGPLTTINAFPTETTIGGLQPATTYWIWARAQNSVGFSSYSAPLIATTYAGARIKVGSDWKLAVPYVKDAGVWKLASPWVKVAGVWKETI